MAVQMTRQYVMRIAACLALLLGLAVLISVNGLDNCIGADRYSCGLLHYQQKKIAGSSKSIDLAFFGDSSLGNAVDAKQLSEISHQSIVNLALNGAMGLPVIYLQMKEALAQPHIRNAVIMLSPEAYRHHYKRGSALFVSQTYAKPDLLLGISPRVAFSNGLALSEMIFDEDVQRAGLRYILGGPAEVLECPGCADLDYIVQSDKRVTPGDSDLSLWKGPYRDYDPFLERIVDLCQRYQVNCLYMHGPIMQEALDNNPTYVSAVDRKIEKFGLMLVAAMPIIIPDDDVGNAINHVRPDLRPLYSERIFKILQPMLK